MTTFIAKAKNLKHLFFLARLEHDFKRGLSSAESEDARRDFSEALLMIAEIKSKLS